MRSKNSWFFANRMLASCFAGHNLVLEAASSVGIDSPWTANLTILPKVSILTRITAS
jgi:hypothetical protein